MFPIVYYARDAFMGIFYLLCFLGFLFVISYSRATPQFRLLLSISTAAVLYGYNMKRMESRNMLWIISLILVVYTMGNPDFNLTIAIMILTIFYALATYIPPNYLGMMMFICMLGFYTAATLHAIHMFVDNYAQCVTVALAVLTWNLIIGVRPAFHLD